MPSLFSGFFQEAGFKHQAFDFFGVALDVFLIMRQADIFDQRAAFKGNIRALDRQILDKRHRIAILQNISVGISYGDLVIVAHIVSFCRCMVVENPVIAGQ